PGRSAAPRAERGRRREPGGVACAAAPRGALGARAKGAGSRAVATQRWHNAHHWRPGWLGIGGGEVLRTAWREASFARGPARLGGPGGRAGRTRGWGGGA